VVGLIAAIERVPVQDKHLEGIVVDQIPIGDGSRMVDVGSTVTLYVGALEPGNGNGNDGGNGNGNGNDGGDGGDRAPARSSGVLPRHLL
jgi:hypothetical protein